MADQQRVHPVHDPEAPVPEQKPTAPLVPRGSSRSENGDPARNHPPPPLHRAIPYAPLKPPKKKSCCKKCLCWTISLLLLIILILGIVAAVIYFVFQPRIPKYSVDSMRITQFNLSSDNSLAATFNVNITARNPNRRIGIYYEGGSHLRVLYRGTRLCQGSLPRFYQGHRNTTVLNVMLAGQTRDAAGLLQSLQAEQQAAGSIPLNLRGRVPVRIRLGKLKLMEWKFLVRCRLMVDSLSADNVVRITNSSCRFRFRL
ncbi:protein yls9 [Phtheirospermum japonicum]|uniref:Protein yls9 n=1 Tax=Phtheirospermum japonicum TaxID=374723 RepID=A0A830D6V9_9LAMI|nr:protein yls9 [Phtheirospermum japonicum]